MKQNFNKYIIFWLSQSISQLGSAMTSFALILWAYTQNGSAMTVSLMSFFNYVPYIIVSLFAGTFVDNHSKKIVMLVSDSIAAVCSVAVLVLCIGNGLQIYHIYIVNFVIGFMNAFQGPASAVAVGKIVPKEKLAQVSGMNSFSGNLIAVMSPVLAASLFALGGLKIILFIDLTSFLVAFFVLLLLIAIPENIQEKAAKQSMFEGCSEGYRYLKNNRGIFTIIITMALLNFFSRLTYENILSPMILARSGNDSFALGLVNALMGLGGFAASFPIPFINAGQNVILYQRVPEQIQGRVFAVRNAIQFSTIPLGILLGGFLADYVFEPFMAMENGVSSFLHILVGQGAGSGMAVMFLCTGVLGSLFSLVSYRRKELRELG